MFLSVAMPLFLITKLKAASMVPPSHDIPFPVQSKISCSDKDMSWPVFNFTMPSIAAAAENAQQHPSMHEFNCLVDIIHFG
jgi:hypothetical protein